MCHYQRCVILVLLLTGRTALLMAIDNENLEMVRIWIGFHPHPDPHLNNPDPDLEQTDHHDLEHPNPDLDYPDPADPDPDNPDPDHSGPDPDYPDSDHPDHVEHQGGVAAGEQSGDERRSAARNQ